ncbi:MAG: TonB family protein [Myxococcales bacterium]|nr:TonB family protein [Myxococcales bacterium]MDD9971381.1 TonB family protein [Myxococcales bacterium]
MPSQQARRPRQASALFETVLGGPRARSSGPRRRAHGVAWLVALSVHFVLLALANRAEPSLETWSARMAAAIHRNLAAQAPIAIEAPPATELRDGPPPEPAEVSSLPPEPVPRPAKRTRPVRAPVGPTSEPDARPAPPTEAGRVVAAPAEPWGPVDLTDATFVSGTATTYLGGASAGSGTNEASVPQRAVDRNASSSSKSKTPSGARPVQLLGGEWRCDWPEAAVVQDIYEQFVVIRVVVRADGTVERATTDTDPGHGFGRAAVECARRMRFSPARDASGLPVRATSPPIRVRFMR